MYTIKLTEPYPEFAVVFDAALSSVLATNNMSHGGVHPFLGKDTMFSVAGFRVGDGYLNYDEWVLVNQSINVILDELNVSAKVQNDRYRIREGRRELTDYKRRKRWSNS